MKVIYLVTTCAYCLQFIANYLTVLTEIVFMNVDFKSVNAWGIWGIYILWLLIIALGIGYTSFINDKR